MPLVKTSMAEPGELLGRAPHPGWQSWVLSGAIREGRELMVYGVEAGNAAGASCVGLDSDSQRPWNFILGMPLIPQSELCSWGRELWEPNPRQGRGGQSRISSIRQPATEQQSGAKALAVCWFLKAGGPPSTPHR